MTIQPNNIYHTDCFEGFKHLPDNSVTHVFTSPPYNTKRNTFSKDPKARKYIHFKDNIPNYFEFLCNAIDESLRVSTDFVFFNIGKNYRNKKDIFKLIGHYSDKIIDIVIWNKNNPYPSSGNALTNAYEFILVLGHKKLVSKYNYTKNVITTNHNGSNKYKGHSALMPFAIPCFFFKHFCNAGETILDPFSGLATTAICARMYDMNYIGFELIEEYFNDGNERLKEEFNPELIP